MVCALAETRSQTKWQGAQSTLMLRWVGGWGADNRVDAQVGGTDNRVDAQVGGWGGRQPR